METKASMSMKCGNYTYMKVECGNSMCLYAGILQSQLSFFCVFAFCQSFNSVPVAVIRGLISDVN